MPGDATSEPSAELVAEARELYAHGGPLDCEPWCLSDHGHYMSCGHCILGVKPEVPDRVARFVHKHAQRATARLTAAASAALHLLETVPSWAVAGPDVAEAARLLSAALGPLDGIARCPRCGHGAPPSEAPADAREPAVRGEIALRALVQEALRIEGERIEREVRPVLAFSTDTLDAVLAVIRGEAGAGRGTR